MKGWSYIFQIIISYSQLRIEKVNVLLHLDKDIQGMLENQYKALSG